MTWATPGCRRYRRAHALEACLPFAGFAYVGESMTAPALYVGNNVAQGVTFLDTLVKAGVRRLESAWSWHLAHPDGYPIVKV